MVGRLLALGIVLGGIGQDVRGPGEGADVNLLDLLRLQIVIMHDLQHGRDRSVRQSLGGEGLHPAPLDAPRLTQPLGQHLQLPFRSQAMDQPFFAIDHVLGTGVTPLGQQRRHHPGLGGHRVHRVLHHRELAGGHRSESRVVGSGDPDGVLDLLPGQPKHPTGDDGSDEGGQRGVVPAALADSREGCFAQAHLELMPQNDTDDQILPAPTLTLTAGECRWDDIGWVGRILLPVDIVVVHHPDHEGIGQGGRDDVHLFAAPDHRGRPLPGDFVQHLESVTRVFLKVSTQRATNGVE